MFAKTLKSGLGKAVLAAAMLGGALSFAGAPSAQAADRDHGRDRDRDRIVRYDRRDDRRFDRDDYRFVRREHFERGWYDRFGCWHRY